MNHLDASALRNQTSVREGIANEELMTKFQLIVSLLHYQAFSCLSIVMLMYSSLGPPFWEMWLLRLEPEKCYMGGRPDATVFQGSLALQQYTNPVINVYFWQQSKIREAVAVIRPCLGNENAALMALQELEELATVNLTATSTEEAPPLPTTVLQRMNCPPTPAVPLNVVAPGSSPQPTATETAPFTGAPMSFDVTVPPMNVSAPFDAPTGMESEHPNPMSWFLSNEAES
ncbi:hypothetical protein Cgig2_013141 [Carnegiea gigantea]|uniref:Uncharacterized protein n=1 Tax=Carnegiea gigantea TaxID=171969 RepID=A0A9Q1KPK9_9CARY|nr:hypothetical protein Cgig2_013141 [Carnegiea gigantea]